MLINKITLFSEGFREGKYKALLDFKDLLDKGWTLNELKLFVDASLNDIDLFVAYGSNVTMEYIEHKRIYKKDGTLKGSVPIKAKIVEK